MSFYNDNGHDGSQDGFHGYSNNYQSYHNNQYVEGTQQGNIPVHRSGYQRVDGSNPDIQSTSFDSSIENLTPVEPLRYMATNQHPSQNIEQQVPPQRAHPQAYQNFINNQNTSNNIRTPPTAYNEVFVQSNNHSQQHIDSSEQMYQVPTINVIQNTPDLIHAESPTTENGQIYPLQNQRPAPSNFFNENDYYYKNSNSASPQPTPSVISADEDTQPILHNNNSNYQSEPYAYQADINNYYNDPEAGYIDRSSDDYQINSYLGRDGEVVDPYSSTLPTVYDDGRELSDANLLSHRDLGEYDEDDELKTIDKLDHMRTSSTSSSTDSENALLNNDNSSTRNMPRRAGTEVKKFKLWRGNFVFDSPISNSLLNKYHTAVENESILSNEFKFMRYQAVTCEPNELARENFTVRQLKYLRPRQTELMIVITMYNEDHILLGRTLKGVMDNIKYMIRKKNSSTWGPDAWKKIVVCIVSDGRSKINEKSLALLSSLGCFQDGFAKDEINDKSVAMHVYEHTTMVNIADVNSHGIELKCNQSTVPIQLLFGLKEKNQKKINSHRWAFEGFAELLQPNIVTLLDAGTMPGKDSIYELWREFRNPNVGGACGEIKTDLGKGWLKVLNPLVASQNFEYKMSNILDKTTESNFGFITVLPGAFSAYRFEAVSGTPLEKYFYGEHLEDNGFNFFSSNMYLAEDRILCFEIVTKRHASWILKYCRSSSASTDVPERVPEFILQRRRWLNGSFFASVYSFWHFYKVWTSGHNFIRKLWLTIEFIYLFFNTLMSWFSLSSFFLVFRILTLSIAVKYHTAFGVLSVVFLWLYGISIFSTFVLSLGNKPKSTEKYYVLNFVFFAILMVYMIFCSIFLAVKSFEDIINSEHINLEGLVTKQAFRDMVISLGSTYVLYIVSSIIYLQPWHIFTSFVQYLLLSPSYINVLNIYAFCNVHDLSWGTKGAVAKPLGKINTKEDGTFKMEVLVSREEIQANYDKFLQILNEPLDENSEGGSPSYDEKKTGYYANVRSLVIIFWVMTNFGVVAAVLETGGIGDYLSMKSASSTSATTGEGLEKPLLTNRSSIYFSVILWLVALSALIRFIGCALYMINRLLRKIFRR